MTQTQNLRGPPVEGRSHALGRRERDPAVDARFAPSMDWFTMRVTSAEAIRPTHDSPEALYDPFTGQKLIGVGEALTAAGVKAMRDQGMTKLIALAPGESAADLIRQLKFKRLNLMEMTPGTKVEHDLYGVQGNFLMARGTVLTAPTLASLARRKVREIYVERRPDPERLAQVKAIQEVLLAEQKRITRVMPAPESLVERPEELNEAEVERMTASLAREGRLEVPVRSDTALLRRVKSRNGTAPRRAAVRRRFVDIYRELIEQTRRVFAMIRDESRLDGAEVAALCDQIIHAMIEDRELLLCSIFFSDDDREYLARHATNVAILAINIATAHGYDQPMVMEVGYGALLSDVGMLDIPDAIRFKKDALTARERQEIRKHTIHGIERLQAIRQLPRTTPIIAYQSHERLDGSGYPGGKTGYVLHDFSKLVMVADVYHAMVDKRPFREDTALPYKAVEECLHMAAEGKLDKRFVRSLLAAASLFPVGSWVELNNGEVARVLAANSDNITRPVVAILYNPTGKPCPPLRVDLREEPEREVVRAVKVAATDPTIGF